MGRAFYEIGDADRAFPLVEEAVKRNPKNPEAWYYLGLVRDERAQTADATVAFLRSRELDLEVPAPPWSFSHETFESTVLRAIAALPESLKVYVREGEVYVAIESPRGEIGCYIASDGSSTPYRMHVRGPSFVNIQCLPHMMRGGLVADAVAVISSVDPVLGEVDR